MNTTASTIERSAADPLEREIVIYSKPGCCLCDDAKPLVAALAAEFGLQVHTANILDDAHLTATYRYRIPVVAYQDIVLDEGRITTNVMRKVLQNVLAQHASVRPHDPGH